MQPLKEKINEIEHIIKSNGFSIFGVVEANFFLNNDKQDILTSGYKLVLDKGRHSPERNNARCALYVSVNLSVKIRTDLMDDNVPEIWVEVAEPRKKRVLLCLFYREFSEWGRGTVSDSIKRQEERCEKWTKKVGYILEESKDIQKR